MGTSHCDTNKGVDSISGTLKSGGWKWERIIEAGVMVLTVRKGLLKQG